MIEMIIGVCAIGLILIFYILLGTDEDALKMIQFMTGRGLRCRCRFCMLPRLFTVK